MGSLLHYRSVRHDHNIICIPYCCKLVSDNHSCSILRDIVECSLYDGFCPRIQCACSLIEQEDLWIRDNASRDGNSLLLTTGKHTSALSDLCLETIGKFHNKVISVG